MPSPSLSPSSREGAGTDGLFSLICESSLYLTDFCVSYTL